MVDSVREIGVHPGAKIERARRFYIASTAADAAAPGDAIRSHGGVENGLHGVMDMVFRDDECRIRTKNAPPNFAAVKQVASNLLRRARGKDSLRVKRRLAAWDDDFLASLVSG
jgi:predicted transposase YbfD/YdcC